MSKTHWLTKEDFFSYYDGNTIIMMNAIHAMVQNYIDMGAFSSWSQALSTGSSELSAKGLRPDTEYMLFAFGVSRKGVITSHYWRVPGILCTSVPEG